MRHKFEKKDIPKGESNVLLKCQHCGRIVKKLSNGSRLYYQGNGTWSGNNTYCIPIKTKVVRKIYKTS